MISWNGILREHLDGLEGGGHAVGDVRVEEGRVVGGDDELDLAEHVERAAARHALHRRDDGLPAVHALRADVTARVVVHPRGRVAGVVAHGHPVRVRFGMRFGTVDAGAEGLALTGQDDAAHLVVVAEAVPHLVQLVLHLLVDRIEYLRTVERDPGDAVALFDQQSFVGCHAEDSRRPLRYNCTVTVWDLIERAAAERPNDLLLADDHDRALTTATFREEAERAAAGLQALGVGPGDVVSWQLPTTLEALVLLAACARLGVVQNPIIPVLREREVALICQQVKPALIVVPEVWRNFGHGDMARAIGAAGGGARPGGHARAGDAPAGGRSSDSSAASHL